MTRLALRGDPTPPQVRLGFLIGLGLGIVAGFVVTFAVASGAEAGDYPGELIAKIVVWLGAIGLLTLLAGGLWRYSGVGWAVGMILSLALTYAVGAYFGSIGS